MKSVSIPSVWILSVSDIPVNFKNTDEDGGRARETLFLFFFPPHSCHLDFQLRFDCKCL